LVATKYSIQSHRPATSSTLQSITQTDFNLRFQNYFFCSGPTWDCTVWSCWKHIL